MVAYQEPDSVVEVGMLPLKRSDRQQPLRKPVTEGEWRCEGEVYWTFSTSSNTGFAGQNTTLTADKSRSSACQPARLQIPGRSPVIYVTSVVCSPVTEAVDWSFSGYVAGL